MEQYCKQVLKAKSCFEEGPLWLACVSCHVQLRVQLLLANEQQTLDRHSLGVYIVGRICSTHWHMVFSLCGLDCHCNNSSM